MVPEDPTAANLIEVGRILRSRRVRLGLTQPGLEGRILEVAGGDERHAIKQRTISDLETGRQDPLALTSGRLFNYLRALEWSPQEFGYETGLGINWFASEQRDPVERFAVDSRAHHFPVYGSVSAGTADAEPIAEESVPISLSHLRRAGVNPKDVRVFLVNGDCMVSDSIRRQRKNIAEGDFIGVNTAGMPTGDGRTIVCVYDHDTDKMIIKRYREENDAVVLYPANGGTPIVRPTEAPEFHFIGVVFWRSGNTL